MLIGNVIEIMKEERAIWMKAAAVSATVETILKRDFDVSWFKPSSEDELRLLKLAQWRERYHASISWMLHQLIPIWRKKFSQYSRHRQGLGVSIATLVGKKSEEIIKIKILEEFPDQELHLRWRSALQQRQWNEIFDESKKEDWSNPAQAIARYKRRIEIEREERKAWEQRLRKRHYRNNPWLG
jgi:hypothetical protein